MHMMFSCYFYQMGHRCASGHHGNPITAIVPLGIDTLATACATGSVKIWKLPIAYDMLRIDSVGLTCM